MTAIGDVIPAELRQAEAARERRRRKRVRGQILAAGPIAPRARRLPRGIPESERGMYEAMTSLASSGARRRRRSRAG